MSDCVSVARAQEALGEIAFELLRLTDRLENIHRNLPRPADLADRQEHRKAYDRATEVLATVECVLGDCLRPAIESLQRAAQVTDAELEAQFREWQKRQRQWWRQAE